VRFDRLSPEIAHAAEELLAYLHEAGGPVRAVTSDFAKALDLGPMETAEALHALWVGGAIRREYVRDGVTVEFTETGRMAL
jgi:CTP-dependent riboflavin kinase